MDSTLTYGFLRFPRGFEELTEMITALDAGESVNLLNISDPDYRDWLIQVVSYLPVEYSETRGGFNKSPDCLSLSGIVLWKLLELNVIKQPSTLSDPETVSFRSMQLAMDMTVASPTLIFELPIILTNLIDGNAMKLDGISDDDLREQLERLLIMVDMKPDPIDGSFCLPSKKKDSKFSYDALINLRNVFTSAMSCPLCISTNTVESGDSNSSSDDGDDDSSTDGSVASISADITHSESMQQGPQRPSAQQLVLAQQAMQSLKAQGVQEDSDDDEDDDGLIGPSAVKSASIQQQPRILPIFASASTQDNVPQEGGREEWMLTPGERSGVAGMIDGNGNAIIKNRKFDGGKKAKSDAQELANLRAAEQAAFENSEEGQRMHVFLQEHRESRGDTLMDQHMNKKAKLDTSRTIAKRPAFDRERDIVQAGSRASKEAVTAIVRQAKEIDSRFSKGSYQT